MYNNEINMVQYPIDQIRVFSKELYVVNLKVISKWYDVLDSKRVSTKGNMAINDFVDLIIESPTINLSVGFPHDNQINYLVNQKNKDVLNIMRIVMPYSEQNYEVVSELYKEVFGNNI